MRNGKYMKKSSLDWNHGIESTKPSNELLGAFQLLDVLLDDLT
jgi:hypothetical protein